MREPLENCVFCQILTGKAPATVTAEWDDAVAIVPLNPVTEGHELVLPRVHVEDALTDSYVTAGVMSRVAEHAPWPCNIITSAGVPATQTVFHLHVHIVPRAAHDGLVLPWTGQELGVSVSVNRDVKCRRVWQPPEVHNLHASECGLLLNHRGPHSWEKMT